MRRFFPALPILLALATAKPKTEIARDEDPLHHKSFKEIIAGYTFVGDFSEKPLERTVSDELFWRYPLKMQPVTFPLEPNFTDPVKELPALAGTGMVYQHINMGRVLYLEGKIEDAKKVWLSARARFGTSYPHHRYTDYLIGYAFLRIAEDTRKAKNLPLDDHDYRSTLANAATFLSWAFIVKKDEPYPLVETFAPKGLYNLTAIYYQVGRFAGAFGAAQEGLDFLRKFGRKEYRTEFHRVVAEGHIKNRSYLEAVQQLDLAIRQDPNPKSAAAMFARVGDIYFNLNNYELAEDAYALANRIDTEQKAINPNQFILRGESLFWLGKFSEAQKMLFYGLNGYRVATSASTPADGVLAFGQLRIADAYVARKEFEKAKLEYFRVSTDFRGSEAAKIAKIRSACLELPFYEGKNIEHARKLLEEVQTTDLTIEPKELAWACQVNSYTERERTKEMVERVRSFAERFPESRFLKSMAEPVRSVQANRIEEYFTAGDIYGALSFYEANKKNLFPKVSDALSRQLFVAYVDALRSEGAIPFWTAYQGTLDTDLKMLRMITMMAEVVDRSKNKVWDQKQKALIKGLEKRQWIIEPSNLAESYANRILAVQNSEPHYHWLFNLVRTWSQADQRIACDLQLPIVARLAQQKKNSAMVDKSITDIISASSKDTNKLDSNCLMSYLELEQKLLKNKVGELGSRYIARSTWPLTEDLTGMFWGVAEMCHTAGNEVCAKTLWEHVRDKAPAGSPEVKLSRARLDPTRTELEGLWDTR